MDRLPLPAPRMTADGEPLECKSWLAYGGAYQLTLWSIVVPLHLELHSSYLGHPDGETVVTHMHLAPGAAPELVTERHPGRDLSVRDERRFCLYDHLAALRERVSDVAGVPVQVDVSNLAPDVVDVA